MDAIPFDDSIGKMSNLPIVHAIYTYDYPESLRTFLLRFNNAIYIKNMKNTLLFPNQAREHGTILDDVSLNLDHKGQSTFSISTSEHAFHLQQHVPKACLQLRRPTNEEMDNLDIIDITDEHEWKPYNESHRSNYLHFSMITTTV